MNFIAMDFETANSKRSSACSIALTVVKNNIIIDELYSLINPIDYFSKYNIKIHGITEETVKTAPTFKQLWPHIKFFFQKNKIVVAHNASFDNSVLKNTLQKFNLEIPDFLSIDTLKTSKLLYKNLSNYKLNTICSYLDIKLLNHHNALDDCEACANILLCQLNNHNDEIQNMIKKYKG